MKSITPVCIPSFGLGTYRLKEKVVIDTVTDALEIGYRAIDTAQIYDNEADIGFAIEASEVPRDDLFLTTKIWTTNYAEAQVIPSLQQSLDKLRTNFVELTLIHWPSPQGAVPLGETLNALMKAKDLGLTKKIGVSNFPIALLKEAINLVGANNISTNQIELSPYLQNRALVSYANSHQIHITSYMTLAYGKALNDPTLIEIANKHKATTAQVALAWAMQLGYAVIPSSTKRANLESNYQSQNIVLSAEDMACIALLERNGRLINPPALAPTWDN